MNPSSAHSTAAPSATSSTSGAGPESRGTETAHGWRAQAMVLAAGRGERMRPLTDHTPKPLLAVRGQSMLNRHLHALARGGCERVVVNTAWLEGEINKYLNEIAVQPLSVLNSQLLNQEYLLRLNGRNLAVRVSAEGRDFGGALETAGGICRALPLLDEVFWVVAGDVFVPGFGFAAAAVQRFKASDALAHLWVVPNPAHNTKGDFALAADGRLHKASERPDLTSHTYSTIGLYRAALFAPPFVDTPVGNPGGVKAPLAPILFEACRQGRITGEVYAGEWTDVGTPERLAALNAVG